MLTKDETLQASSLARTTDLERRVLAHEKVLQALIAFMARSEPRLIDHLIERFVELPGIARREDDPHGTADCTEEFIRAAMPLEEVRATEAEEPEMTNMKFVPPKEMGERENPMNQPAPRDGVQVRQRHGIWEVRVDGKFRGDYHQQEHALAAAALHRLSPR